MLSDNRVLTGINELIDDCKKKSEYHKENATNSTNWWNFLGLCAVFIGASQALTVGLQTVYNSSATDLAVSSGIFAFCSVMFNRIQMSFSFNTLSLLHFQTADDYTELLQNLQYLLIDPENIDENLYRQYVSRHISITEKSHIQPVQKCWFFSVFCCC